MSVGVIVTDPDGRFLLLHRAKPPVGLAPIAGHVDEHGGPRQAAYSEAWEEAGLDIGVRLIASAHLPNLCRRPSGSALNRPGHDWWVYATEVGRDPATTFSVDETKGGAWYTPAQLQALAERTVTYACGEISEADWQRDPGLEPVWAHWMRELGHVRVSEADLAAVAAVFCEPPA